MLRCLHRALRIRSKDPTRMQAAASEAAGAHLRMIDTFFYSLQLPPLLCSGLRVINQCEPAGALQELAQGYIIMALLAHTAGVRRLAARWSARAVAIAESTGIEHNVAWVLTRVSIMHIADCRWGDARASIERAQAMAERVGDLRLWGETRIVAGQIALYTGRFADALDAYEDANRLCQRSAMRQVECWSLLGKAVVQTRLGKDAESIESWQAALKRVNQEELRTEAMMGFAGLSLPSLRSGDISTAYESADRALRQLRDMPPAVYWVQAAIAALADAVLSLSERNWAPDETGRSTLPDKAREAVAGLRRHASYFRLAKPHSYLWQGMLASVEGRNDRAMRLWERTIGLAQRSGTPYESARAHLEIGRHLTDAFEAKRRHLEQAEREFARLGCAYELELARTELARLGERAR
jgi:tetratricopeptide (TPR) repeat protein